LEGKSGEHSVLSADARDSRVPPSLSWGGGGFGAMPASRASVSVMGGCRQDNLDRGRPTAPSLGATPIPSRALTK
jgi:hypothetical protein